ncbi:cation transporter, partial [Bacillus mycoides]
MTDKDEKEKQTSSCCSSKKEIQVVPITKETSCCSAEKEIVRENSSCCSSKKEIPVVPITKKTSCCSSNNDSIKIENSSSCCSSELALEKANSSCCSDSSCADPSPPLDTQKISGDGVQTYLVEGMDCGACALTIEKHLLNVSGVEEVRVNFATGKMHIGHDRDVDDIIKEVSNAGFGASLAGSRRGSAPVQKAKNT